MEHGRQRKAPPIGALATAAVGAYADASTSEYLQGYEATGQREPPTPVS